MSDDPSDYWRITGKGGTVPVLHSTNDPEECPAVKCADNIRRATENEIWAIERCKHCDPDYEVDRSANDTSYLEAAIEAEVELDG